MIMEGTLDVFDFILSEKLGMTVQQMRDTMPNDEYHKWRAFYSYRNAMEELEFKKAQQQRGK